MIKAWKRCWTVAMICYSIITGISYNEICSGGMQTDLFGNSLEWNPDPNNPGVRESLSALLTSFLWCTGYKQTRNPMHFIWICFLWEESSVIQKMLDIGWCLDFTHNSLHDLWQTQYKFLFLQWKHMFMKWQLFSYSIALLCPCQCITNCAEEPLGFCCFDSLWCPSRPLSERGLYRPLWSLSHGKIGHTTSRATLHKKT